MNLEEFSICPTCNKIVDKRQGWIGKFEGKETYFHYLHLPFSRKSELMAKGWKFDCEYPQNLPNLKFFEGLD